MRARLAVLRPVALDLHDESAQHAGHAGARPSGGSHWQLASFQKPSAESPPWRGIEWSMRRWATSWNTTSMPSGSRRPRPSSLNQSQRKSSCNVPSGTSPSPSWPAPSPSRPGRRTRPRRLPTPRPPARQARRERRDHPAGRIDAMNKEVEAQGHPDSPTQERAIRDELVNREVLAQAANKRGLDSRDPGRDGHGPPGGARARAVRERGQGAPDHRRRAAEAVRAVQELDGHQRVQGAPHPRGQGRRGQGDHRRAQQGRRLRQARQGEVEGSGLQGQRRRPRLGPGRALREAVRRRRDHAGEGQDLPRR